MSYAIKWNIDPKYKISTDDVAKLPTVSIDQDIGVTAEKATIVGISSDPLVLLQNELRRERPPVTFLNRPGSLDEMMIPQPTTNEVIIENWVLLLHSALDQILLTYDNYLHGAGYREPIPSLEALKAITERDGYDAITFYGSSIMPPIKTDLGVVDYSRIPAYAEWRFNGNEAIQIKIPYGGKECVPGFIVGRVHYTEEKKNPSMMEAKQEIYAYCASRVVADDLETVMMPLVMEANFCSFVIGDDRVLSSIPDAWAPVAPYKLVH